MSTDALPGFPPHDYLTVRELAALLRLKERKIYDLAARGELPCSRATGKLLFPAAQIRAWIAEAQTGGAALAPARPEVILGSHDPLLDWAIRSSQCGLPTFFDGSLDGLDRFVRGEGIAAGVHIHDPATGQWNVPAVAARATGQNAALVQFAMRQRGLVLRPGGPDVRVLTDLAGLRFAPRQDGSGTAQLFADLAGQAGLDLAMLHMGEVARSEDDAVQAVRRGAADVTFGLASVARVYGLDCVPVIEEQFALVVDRAAWFSPAMQRLVRFFGSPAFAERAAQDGGYDVSGVGRVLWTA